MRHFCDKAQKRSIFENELNAYIEKGIIFWLVENTYMVYCQCFNH